MSSAARRMPVCWRPQDAPREDVLPEMRTFLSQKTGLNMAGFHTQPLETIPKNDAGKTLYRELEQYVH